MPRHLLTALLVHSVLTQVVTFVVRPAVTYRAIELQVPGAWLGALAASFAVAPLLLAVPAGQVTDRLGERRVAVTGSLLMAGSAAVLLLAGRSGAGLIIGTMTLGAGQLLCVLAQQATVANAGPAGRLDTAFGRDTFAVSLGQAVGPGFIIVAGGRASLPDTTALFAASLLVGAVLVITACLLRVPATRAALTEQAGAGVPALLRLPGLPRALLVSSLSLAAVDISLVYVPALGTERGWTAGFGGALLTVRALASMTTRLFLGRLVTALGRRRLLVGSSLLAATLLSPLAINGPLLLAVAFTVLLGLALGAVQPMTMAWLATSTPSGLRGRAMSLRLTGNRLGQTVIPSAVGAIAAGVDASGVLVATGAGMLLVAALGRGVSQTGPPPSPTH